MLVLDNKRAKVYLLFLLHKYLLKICKKKHFPQSKIIILMSESAKWFRA